MKVPVADEFRRRVEKPGRKTPGWTLVGAGTRNTTTQEQGVEAVEQNRPPREVVETKLGSYNRKKTEGHEEEKQTTSLS